MPLPRPFLLATVGGALIAAYFLAHRISKSASQCHVRAREPETASNQVQCEQARQAPTQEVITEDEELARARRTQESLLANDQLQGEYSAQLANVREEVNNVTGKTQTDTEPKPKQPDQDQGEHLAQLVQKDEEKLVELTDRSREFLLNVFGFLDSKQLLDAIAKDVLPHEWMKHHPSFTMDELMEQKNLRGEKVQTLDELIEVATIAKPVFEAIMRKIVCDSGLDPELEVTSKEGQPVMLDLKSNKVFTVLSLAPLKSRARMVEKVTNEYEGDFSKVVDVVRCSVVVFTEEQLESVAQALKRQEEKEQKEEVRYKNDNVSSTSSNEAPQDVSVHIRKAEDQAYMVVRLKNRFKEPLFNGYRDALYNIVVKCGSRGVTHVCEVQLHLADIVAHKEATHVFYEYFRTYFNGSRAEKSRMEALERIGGCHHEGNVDRMINSILRGSDLNQLNNLAHLVAELMGDVKVAVLIRRRIFELDECDTTSQLYGQALMNAGKLDEAERVLRQARSQAIQISASLVSNFGVLFSAQGKLLEAEPLFQAALDVCRKQLGNSHPHTLTSISNLASLLKDQGKLSEAEPLCRAALAERRQQLGDSHPNTLESIDHLGSLLLFQGKLRESEPLYREALEGRRQQLGNSHPDTLTSIDNLATLLQTQGKVSEAETLFREAIDGHRQQLGNSHSNTLISIGNLGVLLHGQGKLSEAELLCREALDTLRQQLGNSHIHTLTSINNLAALLQDRGKLSEAELLFREALDARRQQESSHLDTLASINNLASLLQAQGRLSEAEPLCREALDGCKQRLGNSHIHTLTSISNLASLLQAQGKLSEAEPLFREALDARRQQLGDLHVDTLTSISMLASLIQARGKLSEAESLCREALDGYRQQLENSHPNTLQSIGNLAVLLENQGKLGEAEPLYREALAGLRQQLGNSHPHTLISINNLALLLQTRGKLSEAETLFREALDNCRQQLGNSHPHTLRLRNNFASFFYVQGRLSEAEPLFRESLDERRQRLGNSHPDTLKSIMNLARLLTALGRLREAQPLFREAIRSLRQVEEAC